MKPNFRTWPEEKRTLVEFSTFWGFLGLVTTAHQIWKCPELLPKFDFPGSFSILFYQTPGTLIQPLHCRYASKEILDFFVSILESHID